MYFDFLDISILTPGPLALAARLKGSGIFPGPNPLALARGSVLKDFQSIFAAPVRARVTRLLSGPVARAC